MKNMPVSRGVVKNDASKKPLTPVRSASPLTTVKSAKPIAQLKGKEHKPFNLMQPKLNKGDVVKLAKASGTKIASDALTGSKKFGSFVGR